MLWNCNYKKIACFETAILGKCKFEDDIYQIEILFYLIILLELLVTDLIWNLMESKTINYKLFLILFKNKRFSYMILSCKINKWVDWNG